MPVGDRQAAFGAAAASDGAQLQPARVPWVNWRGHLGLPNAAQWVVGPLEKIFQHLGGDPTVLAARRATALPGDFVHPETGTLIEFDEFQHFTSHRLATFAFYPDRAQLEFDQQEYEDNCRKLASRADRYRADKAAIAFGQGGRQRQRAYNDALRDLAAAAIGPPIIRIIAADSAVSGADLYTINRTQLLTKLGVR